MSLRSTEISQNCSSSIKARSLVLRQHKFDQTSRWVLCTTHRSTEKHVYVVYICSAMLLRFFLYLSPLVHRRSCFTLCVVCCPVLCLYCPSSAVAAASFNSSDVQQHQLLENHRVSKKIAISAFFSLSTSSMGGRNVWL